jgi:two-component system chemotaxis response regulator CheB
VLFSRPSIDVLFESAADAYGSALIAIILTGANHDGAKGMKAVSEAGGVVLVQNPAQPEGETWSESSRGIAGSVRRCKSRCKPKVV